MPKRKNEDELENLTKRLKYLEKQLKHRRRKRRSGSSSSSSSCSQCSSSRSSSPASQPADIVPDSQIDRDATAQACNVPLSRPPPPPPSRSPRPPQSPRPALDTGRPAEIEPIPGTSRDVPPIANPQSKSIEVIESIEIQDDDICQAEILEILGSDPSAVQEFGEDINKEVANRFEHTALSGLDKQTRQDLLDKFIVPSNCKKIAAPQLNAEIKAASSDSVIKRDIAIESKQKQMAAAITGIGRILTSQLKCKDKDNNLSKQLMDVARILCDIQHCESSVRRKFALYSLKKDFRDQLAHTKIDQYLFGQDLSETLKTAKAVSKSGSDIKIDLQKPKQVRVPPKFPRNLNWKTGPSARSQPKGPTQKHQYAASSNRRHSHGSSSHRSSHRAKHTRRR